MGGALAGTPAYFTVWNRGGATLVASRHSSHSGSISTAIAPSVYAGALDDSGATWHDREVQISDLAGWVRGVREPSVAPLLAKLRLTLDSFVEIGLGYLSLGRPSGTLSGGEAQPSR